MCVCVRICHFLLLKKGNNIFRKEKEKEFFNQETIH